jgi:hypothetical protein
MSDDELVAVIRRMRDRKLAKADCMGALEQYGQSRTKMEKMFEAEWRWKRPKAKPRRRKRKLRDAAAARKPTRTSREGLKSDDGLDKKPEEKKEEAKPAPAPVAPAAPMAEKKPEEKPAPPMQKSFGWKVPTAPFNEAMTKRGRNAHYGVDAAIEAAEARTNEMRKSGWIDSDPYTQAPTEKLQKSEGSKKTTVNDLIEQKLDYDPLQLELAKARKDWKPKGPFNVKSFDEKDIRFTQPAQLQKAMPKGEGARGGHVIGHTKTGKPIYSDPRHPEHGKYSDEDHYDAHLAHGQHQMGHESELMKPAKRGDTNKRMMHADRAQYHGKMADKHLSMVKQKEVTKLHPDLKTQGDVAGHARKVATSAFKPADAAPEQKQKA